MKLVHGILVSLLTLSFAGAAQACSIYCSRQAPVRVQQAPAKCRHCKSAPAKSDAPKPTECQNCKNAQGDRISSQRDADSLILHQVDLFATVLNIGDSASAVDSDSLLHQTLSIPPPVEPLRWCCILQI